MIYLLKLLRPTSAMNVKDLPQRTKKRVSQFAASVTATLKRWRYIAS
ncbi:MAG: hypothetical protein ACI4JK_12450 [Oscillospiraceae bacterium]